MRKHLKRLSIIMLILFAGIMLNTGKAEAATVKAKGVAIAEKGKLTLAGDGFIRIDINDLPKDECILRIPVHVATRIEGKKYKIVGGQYYCVNRVLTPVSSEKDLALPFF